MISVTQGLLQVTPINEETGYLQLKTGQVEIVNETNTIVHIINPTELTEIINQIQNNIHKMDLTNKMTIDNEIKIIKSKIKTL